MPSLDDISSGTPTDIRPTGGARVQGPNLLWSRLGSGAIEVLPVRPECKSIAKFTEAYLKGKLRALYGVTFDGDLSTLHQHLTEEQRQALEAHVYAHPEEVSQIPIEISRLVQALGFGSGTLLSSNVHFRLVFPVARGKGGVPAHRDSWYSLPHDGLNIWIPCTDTDRNGVEFFPDVRDRRIRIGPKNPLNHHHEVVAPELDTLASYVPEIRVGECLLFSGDHLHRSLPNHSESTRISWDYRIVDIRTCGYCARLNEFAFPDLVVSEPIDVRKQRWRTIGRIFRFRPTMAVFLVLTNSGTALRVIRKIKALLPNLFFR